jgi:hypothetical protein
MRAVDFDDWKHTNLQFVFEENQTYDRLSEPVTEMQSVTGSNHEGEMKWPRSPDPELKDQIAGRIQ